MSLPTQLALRFANALVEGDFDAANSMLTLRARKEWTSEKLQETYEHMIQYLQPPPDEAEVISQLHDWPEFHKGDLGWVYVALSAEEGSEAITVVVSDEKGEPLIRSIEWGRP